MKKKMMSAIKKLLFETPNWQPNNEANERRGRKNKRKNKRENRLDNERNERNEEKFIHSGLKKFYIFKYDSRIMYNYNH